MTRKSAKRSSEKTKARPKGKSGKTSRKMSAAELSDEQRQALLLSWKNKIKPAIKDVEDAQSDLKALYETAKKEGVTKKQIEFAIELESEEGIERIKAARANEDFVARAMNVAIQLDFFGGGKQSPKEKAYADGKVAGMSDQAARVPTTLPTNLHNAWLAGHADGRTALNTQRASGFKPLGAAVDEIARKAGVSESLKQPPPPSGDAAEAHAH